MAATVIFTISKARKPWVWRPARNPVQTWKVENLAGGWAKCSDTRETGISKTVLDLNCAKCGVRKTWFVPAIRYKTEALKTKAVGA